MWLGEEGLEVGVAGDGVLIGGEFVEGLAEDLEEIF